MREPNRRYGNWLGSIIDRKYRLVSPLGQGGMAMVFLAERLHLRDMVAIKILQPRAGSDEDVRRRFQIEAAAAAKVKHPNVVTIYDFGFTDDGLVYIVMELLEGPSLDQEMYRLGRIPIGRVLEIMKPVCSAIHAAHSLGLLHRDIKPPNIILHRGRYELREIVKVLDFGIAKFFESSDLVVRTSEGIVLGTAEYMSPEQCQGLDLDGRSDIYGLSMVCYQMLAAALPFQAPSTAEYLIRQVKEPPIPLRKIAPEVAPEVEAVIMLGLAKNPQSRPSSAMEFIQLLENATNKAQVNDFKSQVRASGHNQLIPPGLTARLDEDKLALLDPPPPSSATPKFEQFVGRDMEMAQLVDVWQKACNGETRPVLLMGEPGVGKTLLLEELARRVDDTGALVLRGRFYRTPGVRSFHVMIGELKKFSQKLQAKPDELHAIFGNRGQKILSQLQNIWQTGNLNDPLDGTISFPGSTSITQQEMRVKYFQMLAQALAIISRRRPVLLALDDLHWADDSARELFDYLVRSTVGERLFICATTRAMGEQDSYQQWLKGIQRECQIITLRSFKKQQIFALLEAVFGRIALSESQFSILVAETGGNPYFLIETLKLLLSDGRIKFDGKRWVFNDVKCGLPQTLIDLVELSLDKLGIEARRVFENAAVIGEEFAPALLQSLLGIDEDDLYDLLDRGVESSLLATLERSSENAESSTGDTRDVGDNRFGFRNATIRRVLYENMNKRARRRTHRAIAQWFETNDAQAVADLSLHYYEANEWAEAFRYNVLAAVQSSEDFQVGEMRKHLSWAEKSLANLTDLRSLEKAIVNDKYTSEQLTQSVEIRLLATYRWLSGLSLIYRGRINAAEQQLQNAIKLCQPLQDNRLLGQISATLALGYVGTTNKAGALEHYKQALDYYRRSNDLDGQSEIMRGMSIIYEQHGDYTRALDCTRAASEFSQACGNRVLESFALSSEAWMLAKLRRFEEAALVGKRALSLARRAHDQAARCAAYNAIAQIYTEQGLYQEALHPRQEALRIARNLGNRRFEMILTENLGELYFYLSKLSEAENYLLKVLKLLEVGSILYFEQSTLQHLVRVSTRLNKMAQARAYLMRAQTLNTTGGFLEQNCEFHAVAAELLCTEGKYREAVLETDQAISLARTIGSIEHEWRPLLSKAHALLSLERPRPARDAINKCIYLIEQAAAAITDPQAREKYLAYEERHIAFQLRDKLNEAAQ